MQVVLDTSSLIRFLTLDIKEKAEKVNNLLESDTLVFIPDVVLPELEYVLPKQYGVDRKELADYITNIILKENVQTNPYIKKALRIYQTTKFDMADCIIAAQSLPGKLASFDSKLLKVENVKPYWK